MKASTIPAHHCVLVMSEECVDESGNAYLAGLSASSSLAAVRDGAQRYAQNMRT